MDRLEQDLWQGPQEQWGIRHRDSSTGHAGPFSLLSAEGRGWPEPWGTDDLAGEEWQGGARGDAPQQGLKFWGIFEAVVSQKSIGLC